MLSDLVSSFLSNAAGTVQELRAAVAEDDLAEVARLAHRLRGTSAGFGAHLVADVLRLVETQAKADRGEQLPALFADLAVELDRARRTPGASSPRSPDRSGSLRISADLKAALSPSDT